MELDGKSDEEEQSVNVELDGKSDDGAIETFKKQYNSGPKLHK